jgi:poly(3-hydroxybutyrate) depolymerase
VNVIQSINSSNAIEPPVSLPPLPTGNVAKWIRRYAQVAAIAFVGLFYAQPVTALEMVSNLGENPGDLRMYVHRPSGFREGLPLVVALHGCTQTATDFDDETGLIALAEEIPFLLLLPEQREENMPRRCFRWYDTHDNQSGQGESASILAMVDAAIEAEGVDPDRVFILGHSSGGAMTAVMLANYPNRFAGGAVIAGLPVGCNRPSGAFDLIWNSLQVKSIAPDGADASYACGIRGFDLTDRDGVEWAGYVTDSAETLPESWPLLSLWQGTADTIVNPDNLRELTEQWTTVQGIGPVADESEVIGNAIREVYRDNAGIARIETWSLDGFDHAVPIDTAGDRAACGQAADYVTPTDICLGSRLKCDTLRPEGIGCCYGKPLQTPERRGTRRNICRTSTGLKPA